MPSLITSLGIDRLSVDDRLQLAQEIWESVEREVENESMSDALRQELERRLADSIARPDAVIPWEEVKAQAFARARR